MYCIVPANIERKIHSRVEGAKKLHSSIKFGNFYFAIPTVEMVLFQSEYNDIFWNDPYYSPQSLCKKDSPSFWRCFYACQEVLWPEGAYEIENVRILKNDVVIDAGANMGAFSLLAMHQGAEKVYAFEPIPRNMQYLNAHIKLNHGSDVIIPIPYGIGAKEDQLTFVDRCGGSRIVSTESSLSSNNETIIVNITTLDDFVHENNIPRVDFIKADIEGAERLMLEGARDTIKRFHPRLAICTYHLPDDKEVLTSIIKDIDVSYKITYSSHKLYAW
jgi:FkbM family methyltransferase